MPPHSSHRAKISFQGLRTKLRGGYERPENSESGALTVTARVSNGSSRHAMPSMPELVYAALLYKDGNSPENPPSTNFVQGTETEDGKLNFSFQKPDVTNGTFTLEIFAFKTGTSAADFSRANALLLGKKVGCAIEGDKINVSEPIALSVNSSSEVKGTVSLKIKVPAGCSLEIDDARFIVTVTSPDFIITQAGDGISAGAYQLKFTVKKGEEKEKEEIVHIFSEYINVINGFCTDTWGGSEKGAAKEITPDMISSTVYVRGEGGWYDGSDYKNSATASDSNSGSFLSPFKTIQKAVDTVIARNDGASAYTICIDGTLTQSTKPSKDRMADFSKCDKDLNLTIKALSGTATLNANKLSCVIYAEPASGALDLTLENLVITGGKDMIYSGGVYVRKSTLTMESGEISGNTANLKGGGVYVGSGGTFTMKGGKISNNRIDYGGGVYVDSGGTFIMKGGEISGNAASLYGGGVYVWRGKFEMSDGTISDCTATLLGGGVYSKGTFEMSGTAKITGCKTTSTDSDKGGGGVFNEGTFIMQDGTISGNTASSIGGGVYVNSSGSTFTMNGGTIGGDDAASANTARYGGGVYVKSSATFDMAGGTISNNEGTASSNTGGVYVDDGIFDMSGTARVESNNKVYSPSGSPIYVSGEFSATTIPVATIKVNSYEANKTVLRAGKEDVKITQDVCDKFALPEEECKIVPNEDETEGVLKINAVFLDSESGKDTQSGVTASSAVKTLKKAIELYDKYESEKIIVCTAYTLLSDENTLLTRAGVGKEHLTLLRYGGASDGSGAFTGDLLTISQGSVMISNVTLNGNKEKVNADGSLLHISGSSTAVTLGGSSVTLCNNKTSQLGGAVYISEGSITMEDGKITGNEAESGGGVYVNSDGKFYMKGGTISGNKATLYGSGVYQNGTLFSMVSSAKVGSDNDVYLCDGKTIYFGGSNLTASSPVATITPFAYTAGKQVLSASTSILAGTQLSQTICGKFAVTPDPDGKSWSVKYNSSNKSGVLSNK